MSQANISELMRLRNMSLDQIGPGRFSVPSSLDITTGKVTSKVNTAWVTVKLSRNGKKYGDPQFMDTTYHVPIEHVHNFRNWVRSVYAVNPKCKIKPLEFINTLIGLNPEPDSRIKKKVVPGSHISLDDIKQGSCPEFHMSTRTVEHGYVTIVVKIDGLPMFRVRVVNHDVHNVIGHIQKLLRDDPAVKKHISLKGYLKKLGYKEADWRAHE